MPHVGSFSSIRMCVWKCLCMYMCFSHAVLGDHCTCRHSANARSAVLLQICGLSIKLTKYTHAWQPGRRSCLRCVALLYTAHRRFLCAHRCAYVSVILCLHLSSFVLHWHCLAAFSLQSPLRLASLLHLPSCLLSFCLLFSCLLFFFSHIPLPQIKLTNANSQSSSSTVVTLFP